MRKRFWPTALLLCLAGCCGNYKFSDADYRPWRTAATDRPRSTTTMELVFELVSAQQFAPGLLTSKTFKQAGGVIGRAEDYDWVIPDRKRILSGHYGEVSYRDGAFYLTDLSSNGII